MGLQDVWRLVLPVWIPGGHQNRPSVDTDPGHENGPADDTDVTTKERSRGLLLGNNGGLRLICLSRVGDRPAGRELGIQARRNRLGLTAGNGPKRGIYKS